MYCFCVNIYCTTATGCEPNCSWQIYHIVSYHILTIMSEKFKHHEPPDHASFFRHILLRPPCLQLMSYTLGLRECCMLSRKQIVYEGITFQSGRAWSPGSLTFEHFRNPGCTPVRSRGLLVLCRLTAWEGLISIQSLLTNAWQSAINAHDKPVNTKDVSANSRSACSS
jgi:hypothetical protein